MELKRYAIKYVRDRAKSKYEKADKCYICGDNRRLDFHHYHTLVHLLDAWLKKKIEIRPDHYTDEYIIVWRDEFIDENWAEMYDETVTLCHSHHLKLHSIYGRDPGLHTVDKQKRWVEIQREKHGLV